MYRVRTDNLMEISLWGIVIPAFVFITSFVITWMLYRHFANQAEGDGISNTE